ncbi:minor histocompatibility antigen H13 [Paragonimus westermani]|uniref:Minor histocompatibility antigen H13 n=1 Tax=Paragonimus westermani TaxID=34504 RepID=A0A5J4P076_9TREM|nr:minor histocompatibility antigen H13 [Paragonimus westermani]
MDVLNATDVINSTVNGTLGSVNFGGSMLASFVLFVLAVIPIYVGSVLSQRCCDQVVPMVSSHNLQARMEILTSRDAMHFPLYASFALFGIYILFKHWIANNFIGVTLSILAIECIRLNKFTNGCLLLGGLFFYDIFWVFGTPVMVSVAKTLDAPIKVTFPRDFLTHGVFGTQLALLGLGDIVVPGIFVAMLLRFDHRLNRNGSQAYFYTGYAAYIIGLLTTFVVMHVFQAAQPALLYLVPTCLGFPFIVALIRGDLAVMFSYEDVPEKVIQDQQTSDAIIDATKKNT